jgi:predicted ATPase
VLEDLHWSDVPSMKLIDDALSRLAEEPFMVVALARPELHEIAPDLWRERDAQELRLGTLSRKASTALARRVLGEGIAEETIERVVQQAGGNAFYLEELIRAVAEGAGGSLPETVLAMVQSRLDGLKPEARQVTRAASVFGEVFWAGGVAALVEGTHSARRVEDCLLALVDRELIRPSVSSKIPGEKEYIFRHALVRDEAYATLSEGDRALGHRLAAEWLEQAGRTDAIALVERFGLIGDHFLRGEAWAKGADYLHKAGDAAFKLHAYPEARAHFDRALLCLARLPETDEQRLHRINILLCYHETVWLGEELDSDLERLREALRLAQAIEGPERQSHVEGEATLEAARRSEDSMIIWAAHWIRAWGHANLGDREAAELHAQQANAAFRSFGGRLFTGDWFLATNAGRVLLAGQPAEALILAQEAVDKARRVEGLYGEALAHRFWGQALMALDPPRLEDAEGHLAESERLLEICDAKPEWARTHKAWGLLCLARGDLVEARRHFEEAAAQFEACGLPDELSSVRALLR